MANKEAPIKKGASAGAAAEHICVSRVRFFVLLNKGVIERQDKNEGYDLSQVRCDYIRHLRSIAAGHSTGELDLIKERALLARAQTEMLTRKNALLAGEVVTVKAVVRILANEFSVVRDRLLGIAENICDALAHQDRESVFAGINREIMEVLNALSDPEDVAQRAAQRHQQRSR
jgi:phage terminase Nu1 subunit (DNA packaging protein)